ncbi:MAG: YggS family pyridoxal phosphate-dependent enzyme [Planctomycetota bacterium]|jgi:pyridoxal phosphate enzyme (YggS family)
MIEDGPPAKTPERLVRNVEEVWARIRESARRVDRDPTDVTLVAVTKTVPPEVVRLLPAVGVTDVGENRIQQAEEKHQEGVEGLRWHMIGHLQRNKARRALGIFSLIHSLDSEKLLAQLDRLAAEREVRVETLVQVNISAEDQKHGIEPEAVREFLGAARERAGVRILGLMGMGPFVADPEEVRPMFRDLRTLLEEANREGWYPEPLTELSMGMTNDFEVAVEEGATLVRVGTALFTGVKAGEGSLPAKEEGS